MICNQFKVLTTVCRFCEVRFLIFSYSIYPESQSKCYSRNLYGREDGVHFFWPDALPVSTFAIVELGV